MPSLFSLARSHSVCFEWIEYQAIFNSDETYIHRRARYSLVRCVNNPHGMASSSTRPLHHVTRWERLGACEE